MLPGALVADIGSGTIDAIAADGREAVVAGAGELLTVAVAEALGVHRAAADWIKRGPCVRLDGGQRYEAEDGGRGFLDVPAPAAAAGMLAVPGPGGLLPFAAGSGRQHTPSEWRAIRLRLKQAVLAVSLQRALTALGEPGPWLPSGGPAQLVLVGGPAADNELVGVLARSLPDTITIGRGQPRRHPRRRGPGPPLRGSPRPSARLTSANLDLLTEQRRNSVAFLALQKLSGHDMRWTWLVPS